MPSLASITRRRASRFVSASHHDGFSRSSIPYHHRFARPSSPPVAKRFTTLQVESPFPIGRWAFSLYSCERSELDPLVAQQQKTRHLRYSVAKFWRDPIALALEVKATCFFSLDVGAFPLCFVSGPGSVFVLRKYGHRSGTREFPQSFGGTPSFLDSGIWLSGSLESGLL